MDKSSFDYLRAGIAPTCVALAVIYGYKKFIQVPKAFSIPIHTRKHII